MLNWQNPARIARLFGASLDSDFLLLDVRSTLSSQNITDSTASHKGEISPVSDLRNTDLELHLIFVEQNISIWLFPRYSLWFLLNLPLLCNRFFFITTLLSIHYIKQKLGNHPWQLSFLSILHESFASETSYRLLSLSQHFPWLPKFFKEGEEVKRNSQVTCMLSYNHWALSNIQTLHFPSNQRSCTSCFRIAIIFQISFHESLHTLTFLPLIIFTHTSMGKEWLSWPEKERKRGRNYFFLSKYCCFVFSFESRTSLCFALSLRVMTTYIVFSVKQCFDLLLIHSLLKCVGMTKVKNKKKSMLLLPSPSTYGIAYFI